MQRHVIGFLVVVLGCLVSTPQLSGQTPSVNPVVAQQPPGYVTRAEYDAVKADLERLRGDLFAALKGLHEQGTIQRQTIERQEEFIAGISSRDSLNNRVFSIMHTMRASPTFRQEMAQAVRESLPSEGILRVENQVNAQYSLSVNGVQYRIPPLTTLDVRVPVGTVTTELVGQEAPRYLTVGAPQYLQRLLIQPNFPSQVIGPPVIVIPAALR